MQLVTDERNLQVLWKSRQSLDSSPSVHEKSRLSDYQVYACGAPPMVEAAHRGFTALCALPEEEFFSDSFTPSVPETEQA